MQGYKTIVVNGAVALIPLVDTVVNNGELVNVVLGHHAVAAVSVLGLVNVILRWVTTTPVFKQE